MLCFFRVLFGNKLCFFGSYWFGWGRRQHRSTTLVVVILVYVAVSLISVYLVDVYGMVLLYGTYRYAQMMLALVELCVDFSYICVCAYCMYVCVYVRTCVCMYPSCTDGWISCVFLAFCDIYERLPLF